MARVSAASARGAHSVHPLITRIKGRGMALLVTGTMILVTVVCSEQSGGPRDLSDPATPTNVVLFLSDTLRACSLHLYGYPIATTPRLDRFAREATVFARHLSHHPATPESVSQMMTGRFVTPWLLDMHSAVAEARRLPDDMSTLPARMREVGFRTGLVTTHHTFFESAALLSDFDYREVVPPPEGRAWASAGALTPGVTEFLEAVSRRRAPFFLYVHAMDTHSPYHGWRRPAPPDLPKARRYAAYDARIADIDTWFGSLLDLLRRLQLDQSTVVIFTSDHGEDHGEMGSGFWNRHHGATLRESQLHVPLIIRVPGDPEPGRVYRGTTAHVDLAPTLVSLAGQASRLPPLATDGVDLSPFWKGGTRPTDPSRLVFASNSRYWGVWSGSQQVLFDGWGQRLSLQSFEVDGLNYPRPVDGDVVPADLRRRLLDHRRLSMARRLELPRRATLRARERVGVPRWAEAPPERAPTYVEDPGDGRWTMRSWRLLCCGPDETCPPLETATPWVPGRYTVRVRFARDERYATYRNRVDLEVLSDDGRSGAVSLRPDRHGLADAGVHEIGAVLRVRFSAPRGGVAITGFEIDRGGPEVGESLVGTREREEQLRALGYLE